MQRFKKCRKAKLVLISRAPLRGGGGWGGAGKQKHLSNWFKVNPALVGFRYLCGGLTKQNRKSQFEKVHFVERLSRLISSTGKPAYKTENLIINFRF